MKMHRLIISLMLAATLMTAAATKSCAAGIVSYEGAAHGFAFSPGSIDSPTDLFDGFKDVMPGDRLTQQIAVSNHTHSPVRIFLRTQGAQLQTKAFLRQMTLTVTQQDGTCLFDSPADQTGQLSDWICLGTFQPDAHVLLDLVLDVPIEMDNAWADAIGCLDWEFRAEELSPAVDTGDQNSPWIMGIGFALSACAIAVLLLRNRMPKPI